MDWPEIVRRLDASGVEEFDYALEPVEGRDSGKKTSLNLWIANA